MTTHTLERMPLGCLSICFYWIVSCLNSTVHGILSSPQRPGLHSHLQSRATENTLIKTTGPFKAQGRMHVQLKKAGQGHESREWNGLVPCSPRSSLVLSRKEQWTGHLPPSWMTAVLFLKYISILDTFISKQGSDWLPAAGSRASVKCIGGGPATTGPVSIRNQLVTGPSWEGRGWLGFSLKAVGDRNNQLLNGRELPLRNHSFKKIYF